ncbi:amino acid ABC transporter permease [Arabiibacter massiliensis]|uniref:amino acid ABC transporter permease n=1 Tax=Arabiibacter massiliensis TaxID=1870985 RepID=UPI0009B9D9F5|nr:amino acid ABC transporter permease [Arabiibacter massiliensis]
MLEIFAPYKWEALFQRWPDILAAFGTTVGISALALVIALALGILFGVLSVSRIPVLRWVTRVYVEVVQNVPLLLQVFVFYAIFPLLGLSLAAFWIGVLAIGIYHGGYISEVVRSGIGSIHRGQFEAAKSQGFSYWQAMFLIILPQAFRIIMPPLAVQAANLVKNTSVLALIAGGELMYFSNSFAGSTSYYGPVYVVAALLYFAICFPLSRLALYLERRTRAHRHLATGDASEALGEDAMEVTPGTHDITGRAAAATMAAGVDTMLDTVDIAPARQAPSPRHPLHVLGEEADAAGRGPLEQAFTGRQAAEIADEIGREIAQEIAEECGGDEAGAARAMRTKSGRVKAHRKLERRVAARRGLEGPVDAEGAAMPATLDAAAEGARDLRSKGHRRSAEADEALASRAETATSDRITRDVRRRVEARLGEDAFLDNLSVPGEIGGAAERLAHVRIPRDEADFDAESEDAVARQQRAARRRAAEAGVATGGPETPEPDDVKLDQGADEAGRIAADDAELGREEDR